MSPKTIPRAISESAVRRRPLGRASGPCLCGRTAAKNPLAPGAGAGSGAEDASFGTAGADASGVDAGEASVAGCGPPLRRGSAVIEYGGILPAQVSLHPCRSLEISERVQRKNGSRMSRVTQYFNLVVRSGR